jgi:hypothetical protein
MVLTFQRDRGRTNAMQKNLGICCSVLFEGLVLLSPK